MKKQLLLLFLLVSLSGIANAVPGDILFSDNFERASIAPWVTTNGVRSNIGIQTSNSGTRSLYTRHSTVTTTSPVTNLSATPFAKIEMWVQRGSDAFSENPEGNENIVIEYLNNSNSWLPLASYTGAGAQGQIFLLDEQLPADALHNSFRVRVRQTGGSGVDFDYWHIDDVIITETGFIPPPPSLSVGECDFFEGTLNKWSINSSGGTAIISTSTSLSPTHSLDIFAGNVSATTNPTDTTNNFQEVTVWIRRGSDTFSENPDGNENLIIEYLNSTGSWVNLETFVGNGAQGQIFSRTYAMPVAAKHTNFRLRLRMQNGSGGNFDHWHVDDVCLVAIANLPSISMQKTSSVLSDGINTINPKRIPGAIVEYDVIATNSGIGSTDNNTVIISDVIPANTSLYVNDISGAGTGPIRFVDGAPPSGLSYNFTSLGSNTDNISFSNNGGASYLYTPSPDANGVDPNVTNIQVSPQGQFMAPSGAGNPTFIIKFRVRVD